MGCPSIGGGQWRGIGDLWFVVGLSWSFDCGDAVCASGTARGRFFSMGFLAVCAGAHGVCGARLGSTALSAGAIR